MVAVQAGKRIGSFIASRWIMKIIILETKEEELAFAEFFKEKPETENEINVPEIKMLLTDCDGCLTDAGMYYSEFGDEFKKFNTRDGMGFSLLKNNGIITGIITSENVELNRRRANKLKLDILESGCKDKIYKIIEICGQQGIALENVCYIGDDINDIDAIKSVGLGVAPSDAMPQAKAVAKYVTRAKGGEGVIREVADRILRFRSIQS